MRSNECSAAFQFVRADAPELRCVPNSYRCLCKCSAPLLRWSIDRRADWCRCRAGICFTSSTLQQEARRASVVHFAGISSGNLEQTNTAGALAGPQKTESEKKRRSASTESRRKEGSDSSSKQAWKLFSLEAYNRPWQVNNCLAPDWSCCVTVLIDSCRTVHTGMKKAMRLRWPAGPMGKEGDRRWHVCVGCQFPAHQPHHHSNPHSDYWHSGQGNFFQQVILMLRAFLLKMETTSNEISSSWVSAGSVSISKDRIRAPESGESHAPNLLMRVCWV